MCNTSSNASLYICVVISIYKFGVIFKDFIVNHIHIWTLICFMILRNTESNQYKAIVVRMKVPH